MGKVWVVILDDYQASDRFLSLHNTLAGAQAAAEIHAGEHGHYSYWTDAPHFKWTIDAEGDATMPADGWRYYCQHMAVS